MAVGLVQDIATQGSAIDFVPVDLGSSFLFASADPERGQELWSSDGTLGGLQRVADIRLGPQSSSPSRLTPLNGVAYFTANDGVTGEELWRSDGTATGTWLVTDLFPGSRGALPDELTVVGNRLYFTAEDPSTGRELWVTDGTSAGTNRVLDLVPGIASSTPTDLTRVGDRLVFRAEEPGELRRLWSTDGSEAGTLRILDSSGSQLTQVGVQVFFVANDSEHGLELWSTDGLPSGTQLVADIRPGSGASEPAFLTNVDGTLYFRANDGTHGPELWKSDGTESGTQLVADLQAGAQGSWFSSLTSSGGKLLFLHYNDATGEELWTSDGTVEGTQLIADIRPGVANSDIQDMTEAGGVLYFFANDGVHRHQLWRSDGTTGGTVSVTDHPWSILRSLSNVGGLLYFTAYVPSENPPVRLFRSDGTAARTMPIGELPRLGSSSQPTRLTNVAGELYFMANDGVHGQELWKSDGTPDGTALVADIRPGSNSGGVTSYGPTLDYDDRLLFTVNDGSHGFEWWTSDGTASGTTLLADINPGSSSAGISQAARAGDFVFFTANDGVSGMELWRTDGTTAGTVRVADIVPGSASSNSDSLVNLAGTLYFRAWDGTRTEIWRSNGSGAERLFPVESALPFDEPAYLTVAGGKLFFRADDGTGGRDVWMSDGTPQGTARVADFQDINGFTAIGERLYFVANDGLHGPELWSVRGDGAELLRLTDSPGYFSAREFTEFNGEVYFAALTDPGDWQLWHSDGSEAGTAPAADHLFFSNLAQLTNVGGMLYFSAAQSATGQELWRSDGTSLGTYRVQDLNPGSADGIAFLSTSDPRNLTNVNGILFFAGTDGAHGRELWSVVPDGLPPTVESVVLANSLSVHAPVEVATGSGEQLRTVAMAGVDRVTLVFSRDVEVSAADLEVAGHAPLAVSGFAYDASLFAATWSLSEPVVADQITLRLSDQVRSTEGWRLDGDWANPLDLNDPRSSSSSGDGVLGGRFEFRFNVLAGDANRDNVVNTADFDIWAANFDHGQGAADKVFTDGDWNGDGHVTGADFTLWADHNQVAFYNWGAGSPDSLPDMLALRAFAKPDDIQPLALDVKLAQRLTTIRDQVLTHESTEPRVDVELTSYRGHSAAQAREDGAGATQDAIVKVDVRERVDARM